MTTTPTPKSGVTEEAADGSTFLRAIPPLTPTNAPPPPAPATPLTWASPPPLPDLAERVTAAERAVEALTANQAAITDYVSKRLSMIDELIGDVRRVLTPR